MNEHSITAIILTYNEEIHLQRCIDSLRLICNRIIVVDSFSTDLTEEIAKSNNVEFKQNPWLNHATQFNWGLDNCDIISTWILRMDADEYLSNELIEELNQNLSIISENVNGITFPLRRVFLGKEIKRGTGNIRLLRLFKNGKGRSENRWMDEHILLESGDILDYKYPFSDDNLNNLSWWTQKHVGYAIREAIDLLNIELDLFEGLNIKKSISKQAGIKRALKFSYAKKPLFLRSFIYFIYRYIIKLGFLEGKEGFLWHFLQGWWYRTLVDVHIYEIKKKCGNDVSKIKDYIKTVHHIDI